MKVYYANQGGSFDKAFLEISTGTIKIRGISVADINKDGKLDIITCDTKSSTVLVYYKTSSGSKEFTGSHKINLEGGKNCHDTTPLDSNNDGWIDVIYPTQQSGELMAFLSPGTGFASATRTKVLVAKDGELAGTHQVAATMTKKTTWKRLWLDMIVCMDNSLHDGIVSAHQ